MSRSSSASDGERRTPTGHAYLFIPAGGAPVTVGRVERPGEEVVQLHMTRDRAEAERWRLELSAGRVPG